MKEEGTGEHGAKERVVLYKECKYISETVGSKIRWLLIGIILGFFLSLWLSHYMMERARVGKAKQWINAVISEIDYNLIWKTDSPAWKVKGDSVPFKAHLVCAALKGFLNNLPDLGIARDSSLNVDGRLLLTLTESANQVIDERNRLRNYWVYGTERDVEKLVSWRENYLRDADTTVKKHLGMIIQRSNLYKQQLAEEFEKL